MVGHQQLGPVGDNQPRRGHPLGLHLLQLGGQLSDVQRHAVADHVGHMGVKYPRGQRMQGKTPKIIDDGVPRVGPSLKADDHVGLLRQQVGDLALPLIAPVGAYNRFYHSPLPPGTGIRSP